MRAGLLRASILLVLNLFAFAFVDIGMCDWFDSLGLRGSIGDLPLIHPYHFWILNFLYPWAVFIICFANLSAIEFPFLFASGLFLLEGGSLDLLFYAFQQRPLPMEREVWWLTKLLGRPFILRGYEIFLFAFLSWAYFAIAVVALSGAKIEFPRVKMVSLNRFGHVRPTVKLWEEEGEGGEGKGLGEAKEVKEPKEIRKPKGPMKAVGIKEGERPRVLFGLEGEEQGETRGPRRGRRGRKRGRKRGRRKARGMGEAIKGATNEEMEAGGTIIG
jgi:hypothetical protein